MKWTLTSLLTLALLTLSSLSSAQKLNVPSCAEFSAYGASGSWISDGVTKRFFGKTVGELSSRDLRHLVSASELCVKRKPQEYSLKNAHDILNAVQALKIKENAA